MDAKIMVFLFGLSLNWKKEMGDKSKGCGNVELVK
jgi:hypothetical protein